jgi:hypothetical protein
MLHGSKMHNSRQTMNLVAYRNGKLTGNADDRDPG